MTPTRRPAARGLHWAAAALAPLLLLLGAASGCLTNGAGVSARSGRLYAQRLQTRLNGILAANGADHAGVLVVDAADQQVLYAHNADQRYIPASVSKLFTAAAALYTLGPSYRFATEMLGVRGTGDDPRQLRSLVLRGSGDPSLRDGHLRDLALSLQARGVRFIAGDLLVDDGAFGGASWGPGWTWDDLSKGYGSPVSGLNVMHNAITLELRPGAASGTPATLQVIPDSAYVQVNHAVITGSTLGPPRVRLQLPRQDAVGLEPGDTLQLCGVVPADPNGGWSRALAVRDGALFAGQLLREQLQAVGIEVAGVVRRAATPPEAVRLGLHLSADLGVLLSSYMKASDNLGMECILKRMGAQRSGQPGTFANGAAAVRQFLTEQVGLPPGAMRLADGSGDSRYNLATPRQMVRLLAAMRQSFAIGPEFVAVLPIGGADGTLRGRMQQPPLQGAVRAKTGTMTAVSGLAGYLHTQDQQVLIYALLNDGALAPTALQRRLQEALLQELARAPAAFGGGGTSQ